MTTPRRYWYVGFTPSEVPLGRVQVERHIRGEASINWPEHVLRLAHAEYERRFPGQDYEQMQERHGLGVEEVVMLLADYLDRLGAEPTKPREP